MFSDLNSYSGEYNVINLERLLDFLDQQKKILIVAEPQWFRPMTVYKDERHDSKKHLHRMCSAPRILCLCVSLEGIDGVAIDTHMKIEVVLCRMTTSKLERGVHSPPPFKPMYAARHEPECHSLKGY